MIILDLAWKNSSNSFTHQYDTDGRSILRGLPLEAQVLALMKRQPNLLNAAPATVVPQEPLFPIEDRIRLVNGVVVPLVLAGANDGISSMTLPVGDPVLGTGNADLGVVPIPKADVEHEMPVTLANDLTGSNSVFLPGQPRIGLEDGIVLILVPFQAIFAGRITDGIGLERGCPASMRV